MEVTLNELYVIVQLSRATYVVNGKTINAEECRTIRKMFTTSSEAFEHLAQHEDRTTKDPPYRDAPSLTIVREHRFRIRKGLLPSDARGFNIMWEGDRETVY